MRLKPLVVPSRSRKLLPRLVTAEPADTVELIIVGVGLGGVGGGLGVGVVGAVCAWTGDAAPTRTTTTEIACTSAQTVPIPLVHQGRDGQRMNTIPEKSARLKKLRKKPDPRVPIWAQFARSVNHLGSGGSTEYTPL